MTTETQTTPLKFSNTPRHRTPTVLQMEALECGAASLGMILGYYGRYVPLEELRAACGVSRDGVKASNIVQVARQYGLQARGFRKELADLQTVRLPFIVFWNFNHFLVVEGFKKDRVFINDPAVGPRVVTPEEFDKSFTGVVLTFEPDTAFQRVGGKPSLFKALSSRLAASRLAMTYVILISLALIIPGILVPAFTQIFVDRVLVNGQDWLAGLLIAMTLTALMRALMTSLQQFYLLRLETKLALSTSSMFMWHVLRLPIEFFMQRFGGEISSRVLINDRVAYLLSGELATAVLNLVLVVFYAALLFVYDRQLTLIGITIAVVNIFVLRTISRQRTDANQRLLQENGKMIGTAMNGLQTIESIKATGSEADLFAKVAGYHAKALLAEQQFRLVSQVLSAVPYILTGLNTTVILYFGSLRVIRGELSIGELIAFQTLMLSFITPFNEIVNLGGRIQEVSGDMNRLDDVLRYEIDPRFTQPQPSDTPDRVKLSGKLEIRDLTFGYNRLSQPLIENFSLSIEAGSRVALVGGSGSGKSTIAKLIAGLYQPWSGEILFDGKPREAIPRSVMTNSLAMIDQDIFVFQGSVTENLTLWDYTIPENHIIQAAKDAAIHNDLVERSNGYSHILEEGGRNFSGGQLQRLEIARALVNNPSILVLDEATSALDPLTEKTIDDHLRRRGCTCLIVAHRLSTIRDCDEIIVLDRGRVIERGTHDLLKLKNGLYADLIKSEMTEMQSTSVLEYLF